MQKCRY